MEGVKEIYDELQKLQEDQDFNDEIEGADNRIDASRTVEDIMGVLNEKEKQLAREMMICHSDKEIAVHMDINPSTVRKKKQILREKLRLMIE